MRLFSKVLCLSLFFAYGSTTHAIITGDVSSGGSFFDNVDTDNGWINESPAGNGVDFWSFTASHNSVLDININSVIDFGISVYSGLVSDDLGFAFNNNGDFADPLTFTQGTYLNGTNGSFGELGSSLLGLQLTKGSNYTIAVGGDLGFGSFGPYNYGMDINVTPVPEPASLLLLLSGVLGMSALRRATQ